MMTTTNDVLTPAETARELGLSVERVRQLLRSGRLPHQTTPLGRLIERRDVADLAARRATA